MISTIFQSQKEAEQDLRQVFMTASPYKSIFITSFESRISKWLCNSRRIKPLDTTPHHKIIQISQSRQR
jgi:hypothetical protein